MEIIKLLKTDHREVEAMFNEYEKLGERAFSTKEHLAQKIVFALETHTKIEEALFYPELEQSAATSDMIREALIEHAHAKELVAEIKMGKASAEDFDAKVKVLKDMIEPHVKEEEGDLFPAAEDVLGKERLEAMGEAAEEMKMKEEEQPQPSL